MPDRNNERGWIAHILVDNLSDDRISAAKRIHTALHETDNDETITPKLQLEASKYLTNLARKVLTGPEVAALELSHINQPTHEINPKN